MSDLAKDQEWDFIVIGGGITGLGTGAILANGGNKVLVLERNDNVGGRLRPTEKDGFILDNGLHLLKYGKESALYKTLELSDCHPEYIKFIPIRNYYVYIGLDDEHLKKTLDKECIDKNKWTKRGWLEVPHNVNKMKGCDYFNLWKLIRIYTTCFKCEFNDIKEKSLIKFLAEKRMCRAHGCIEVTRYLKLISTALMHCSDPHYISAGEIFRTIKWMSKRKVLFSYPKGGWQQIIDKLKNKIIENGGKVITDCEVKQLIFQKNKVEDQNAIVDLLSVEGVKTSLGDISSDNVVIAIPPKNVPNLFVDKVIIRRIMPEYQKVFESLDPVVGISIDFALDSVLYKSKTFMYVEEPSGYGSTISNIDPSIAPDGKQLMSFFFPFPHQMLTRQKMVDELIDKCKKGVYKRYPKIQDNILFERVLIHDLVDSVQVDVNNYWDKRPKPKVPGIKGCYLTGDYLRTYGASGELAYNAILTTCTKIRKIEQNYFI
ncbi:MAG: FAD-dependent oxidoreductase [Candidatus Lokiarchaeota archaeon]|nr:FAD-dependent oxidoreductase [Candidatus Lokiarchaeota archaeon]